jgi:hypothetical protein
MNEERLNGGPIGNLHAEERVTPFDEGPNVIMEDNVMEDNMVEPVQESRSISRTIVIEPMNYGYNVKLDCHKFAFESADRALKYISEYLKDPQGTEEKWWKKELF